MKMSKILSLLLVVAMILSTFVACGGGNKGNENKPSEEQGSGDQGSGEQPGGDSGNEGGNEDNPYAALAGTYNITMWVSEIDGVADQFQAQIDKFEEAYPGIIINAQIEGVTEADAGSQVIADVSTAPDIYCFAQDQLARLVQAAALAKPIDSVANQVKLDNDGGSVAAASVGDVLYAYPLTSDNGFYMFYDKSIISEEDAESMERLIEICNEQGRTFRFPLTNGWYNAGFFFATGCSSTWTVDGDGQFNGVNDTYNTDAGLVAMKAMQKLAQAPCYDADNETLIDLGVVISGTWAANGIKEALGENYAATDLPSFEVDGQSYHLGSFTGNKLMGVKPQADSNRAIVLSLLAQFLTNAECQEERFNEFGWGPSNLVAQDSEGVQNDPALAAFAKQGAYGKPQGQIHGDWWAIAEVLGAQAQNATSEQDLKDALGAYENAVKGLVE